MLKDFLKINFLKSVKAYRGEYIMNINKYLEIKPGRKIIKKIYVSVFLWLTGRAIQAAAKTDKAVKKEFSGLQDDFAFSLGVMPDGPYLIAGKDKKNKVKYMGRKIGNKNLTLKMNIKNLESAMLIFQFRESTAVAFANNRFIIDGEIPDAMAAARILDLVEVYLLPKFITKLAVKRYPKWSQMSPFRKYSGRIIIYLRTVLGF